MRCNLNVSAPAGRHALGKWLLGLAVMLTVAAAQSATVSGLNEALVPVAGKSDKARAEAATEALRQVLIKMSGDRKAVAAKPALLRDANQYVLQYQYRDTPVVEDGAERKALMLWMQLDETPLRQLLTDAGLPLWQSDRPSLLLWTVTEQAGAAALAGSEDAGATTQALRQHADRRGVPLVLPLQDLDEQARIATDDIKQNNAGRVQAASARYGAQAVATAVLTQGDDGAWRGRFTLLRGDHGETWVARGQTMDEVVAQGMDQLADALAAPVSVVAATGGIEAIDVHVQGVNSATQFAQVESYLRTVPGVSRVVLARLEPAQVTFRVVIAGGLPTLTQAAATGQTLQAVGTAGEARFRLLQ